MQHLNLNHEQFVDMKLNKCNIGSISSELNRIYSLCKNQFDFDSSYEIVHKEIQSVIRTAASNISKSEEEKDE